MNRIVDNPREPQAKRHKTKEGHDLWELIAGDAIAEVVPSRGGLVTRFCVGNDEVLYMDRETLLDPKKNVRGGIPVLFPIAGRLTGDRFTARGQSYPMRQHGLARQAPWSVINVFQASMTMEFRSSEITRVTFPYEFSLRLTVDLGRAGFRTLALTQEVENLGSEPLPVHLGLHPYFLVPEAQKDQARVESNGKTAYNNVTGETAPFSAKALDFSKGEIDLHVLDHTTRGTRLLIPGKAPRVLSWDGGYKLLVLWTLGYKDFVCVEPWTAKADALNTGEGLLTLAKGETFQGSFLITV